MNRRLALTVIIVVGIVGILVALVLALWPIPVS
jgi:hypothetical protein